MGDNGLLVDADEARQRALDRLQILDTPREERFDRVTRLAQEIFAVPMVSVTFIDRDRQWRKSYQGLPGPEAPRKDAFCDATIRQRGTLVVEDAALDERFESNPFVVGDPHLRFYAGHPLQAPGGERVGTLCILDTEPRTLSPRERELLRNLAMWVQAELSQDDELDRAAVVQQRMLPRRAPELPGYEMAAVSIPAGHLGGDFYDWFAVADGMRLTVADVMGKGLGAALIAAGVRAALHTATHRDILVAMQETSVFLDEDLSDSTTFVTAFHAELNGPSGRLTYIDAGHNLAGIVRADGTWEHLESSGLPLGIAFYDVKATGTVVLEPGDAFLCCSDGLLDLLGESPVEEILAVVRSSDPDGAIQEVVRLADRDGIPDDVTALIVRRVA